MGRLSLPDSSRWIAWLGAAIVGSTFLHFWARTLADPDMWGHLEWGREMLTSGSLPRVDRYSYSATGLPFFDHEWLADVIFAFVFDAAGSGGLLALKLCLGMAIMVGLLDAARFFAERSGMGRPHPIGSAGALVLALSVIAWGATFRPQLFTMAGLAIEWALLERATRRFLEPYPVRPVGWEIWTIPLLMLAWANLHGGFLVGVGLMGLFCAAAIWHSARVLEGTCRLQAILALLTAGGLTLLAPLVNPYGIELYTYLLRTLDDHGAITEWHPVPLLGFAFLRFKVLVVATAAAVTASRSSHRHWDAIWRIGFLGLAAFWGFRHQRHTVLFAVVAAPVLVVLVGDALRRVRERWPLLALGRVALGAVALGVIVVAGIQIAGVVKTFVRHGFDIRFPRSGYPVDAVAFLDEHGFRGNAAVPFSWGSYTVHKLGHRVKVFIDGRFEAVYPPEVIADYFAFVNGSPGWERLLDAYPTDIVVTQRTFETHERMFARKDFVYVYSDPASFVFVRRSPATAPALERLLALERRPRLPIRPATFP